MPLLRLHDHHKNVAGGHADFALLNILREIVGWKSDSGSATQDYILHVRVGTMYVNLFIMFPCH